MKKIPLLDIFFQLQISFFLMEGRREEGGKRRGEGREPSHT